MDSSQGRATPVERDQVFDLVISNAIFPTTKQDANPFEGQSAYRRVMSFAATA